MKLPWLKKPDAPLVDLGQQLAAAEEALNASRTVTQAAIDAFDDDPTPAAEKSLVAARDAERFATEHVARAERLLAAAREREAEARRVQLQERRDVLAAELTREAILAAVAPFDERERDLLLQVAEVRMERLELKTTYQRRAQELLGVLTNLGEAPAQGIRVVDGAAIMPPAGPDVHVNLIASTSCVIQLLNAHIAALPNNDPRRVLLRPLVPGPRDYYP